MTQQGLANPYYQLQDHYDVVVIGSGYGASIAASRFSRMGYKVCVLERGKEYLPNDFPATALSAAPEMQVESAEGIINHLPQNPLGLYNFHINKDVSVLVGCGLGGTSLINANVSIEPDARIFEDNVWPAKIREDKASIDQGHQRAKEMLKATPYPAGSEGYPELAKSKALFQSGQALGYNTKYLDLNVNFEIDGTNHVGIEQHPCNNCGDCCSGCRYQAKNTLDMNYLPDAKNHGAHIFTQMDVRHIAKAENDTWHVHYHQQPGKPAKGNPATSFISADKVVIGAGSLGSTEILLRSKENGLAVSDVLGHSFSGNGDVLAFSYNTDQKINAIGFGKHKPSEMEPVGPCITAGIDARPADEPLKTAMIIEEGSIPGALGSLLPKMFASAAFAFGEDTDHNLWDNTQETYRQIESLTRGYLHGATANTQTCLIMSNDDQDGSMVLKNDKIMVNWAHYAKKEIFQKVQQNMIKATTALGGTYLKNPITAEFFGERMITVHPLGGCVMGDDVSTGVVDHRCEVFDASANDHTATHQGLYIMDGSVIPRSLGVNPLFTICAVAERACAIAASEQDKHLSYEFKPVAKLEKQPNSSVGVTFTEVMRGFVSQGAADYQNGFDRGRTDKNDLSFRLTVTMDDMEAFIANPQHLGSLSGYVQCPLLSDTPLSVSSGTFNLFVLDDNDKTLRRMNYTMVLLAENGDRYFFEGHKNVREDDGTLSIEEIWEDTSTLYVTIYKGINETGEIFAKGIQKILVPDFVDQLKTANATRINDPKKAFAAVAKFGTFFFQQLWETYIEEPHHRVA